MHRTQRMKNMHKTQIAQSTNKDRKHKHFKDQNECGICAFGGLCSVFYLCFGSCALDILI